MSSLFTPTEAWNKFGESDFDVNNYLMRSCSRGSTKVEIREKGWFLKKIGGTWISKYLGRCIRWIFTGGTSYDHEDFLTVITRVFQTVAGDSEEREIFREKFFFADKNVVKRHSDAQSKVEREACLIFAKAYVGKVGKDESNDGVKKIASQRLQHIIENKNEEKVNEIFADRYLFSSDLAFEETVLLLHLTLCELFIRACSKKIDESQKSEEELDYSDLDRKEKEIVNYTEFLSVQEISEEAHKGHRRSASGREGVRRGLRHSLEKSMRIPSLLRDVKATDESQQRGDAVRKKLSKRVHALRKNLLSDE